MNVPQIKARKLLSFTTEQLWTFLAGPMELVFEDGISVFTDYRQVLYSSYAWDLLREYPKTPILSTHHLSSALGKKMVGADTHLKLLGTCAWSVYDTYYKHSQNAIHKREYLAEKIYRLSNSMYNDLIYRLEKYVTSLDILDFVQILNDPEIVVIKQAMEPTQLSVSNAFNDIKKIIQKHNPTGHHRISDNVRAGNTNVNQVMQCVAFRGFVSDIDSSQFPVPVMRGFAEGLRSLHDSFVESRSAAKALHSSTTQLQDTEYFSRRMQFLAQIVKNLHEGDCGSTNYQLWRMRDQELDDEGNVIRRSDLECAEGKYFFDESVQGLRAIRATDKHLIGKTLKVRSILAGCTHPDPYGICSTCFGELSYSVPPGTNIGQYCATYMTGKSSQNVLSTKHLDGNAIVEIIKLLSHADQFLKVSKSGAAYMLSEKIKHKKILLRVPMENAIGISDIDSVPDVDHLTITRVSEINEISLAISTDGDNPLTEVIPLTINIGRRRGSFTYDFLRFVKNTRWSIDNNSNYVFDMTGWNFNNELIVLPLKLYNAADHSAAIAKLLEGSMEKKAKATKESLVPTAVITELCDLVNQKLNINLAILEVTLYSCCVINMEQDNFNLPKANTSGEKGVSSVTMRGRSLSAAMAYEDQKDTILNPASFFSEQRPSHPMDVFIKPLEVIRDTYKTP